MKNKRAIFPIVLFIFCIFFFNLITADVLISNAGVQYDSELIGQFLLNNWVHVTVDIKDTSGITIPNRNSPDFESKIKQRTLIMTTINEAVLSTLSENEFKLKTQSEFGGFFSGNITKEGFDRLLKDERVDHIYAEKKFVLYNSIFSKNFYISIIPILLLIILIILLFKLKKRKWELKKRKI
jgi:hypothetical protein